MYKMLKYGIGIFLITLFFMTLGVATAFASEKGSDTVSSGSAIEVTTESTTDEFVEETTGKPEEPTTGGSTAKPVESTTESVTEETTGKPVETTTEKPIESTSEKTTESTTENTTQKPTESTTEKPVESTTEKPVESTTGKPVESTTERPVESTTEKPAESTTGADMESTTKKEPVYHYVGGGSSSKSSAHLNGSLCRVTFNSGEKGNLNGARSITLVIAEGTAPKQVPKVTARPGSVFTGWTKNGITLTDPAKVRLYANTVYTAMYEDTSASISVLSGLINFEKLFEVIEGF